MKPTTVFTALAAGLLAMFSAQPGSAASIQIDLVSPALQGIAGGAPLSYYGTITNLTEDTLWLNGCQAASFSGAAFPYCDIFGYPVTIGPLETTAAPFEILSLPIADPVGLYIGVFQVLGGLTFDDQTALGEVIFEANIVDATSPVPEPGTLVSLVLAAAGLAAIRRKRSATAAPSPS